MDMIVVIIWLTVCSLGVIFLILVDYDTLLLSNWDNFSQIVCFNPPFLKFWPYSQLPCYFFTVFKNFNLVRRNYDTQKKQKRVDTMLDLNAETFVMYGLETNSSTFIWSLIFGIFGIIKWQEFMDLKILLESWKMKYQYLRSLLS